VLIKQFRLPLLFFVAMIFLSLVTGGRSSAVAGTGPVPRGEAGVIEYNTPVCGTDWIPYNQGHGNYLNIYNAQAGNTCLSAEHYHLAWSLTKYGPTQHGWQYPHISSGVQWGRYTCYDAPSAYPGSPGSQCMRYPVQQIADGMPVTGVKYWPHLVNGNVAYDIWFNQEYVKPQDLRQNDGAEIMIWLDDPGLQGMVHAHTVRTVWVGGYEWDVMAWTMYHNSTAWSYVAYVAPRPMLNVPRLWLNEFFREAEAHGELSKYWYLTSINFGSEINVPQAGRQLFAVPSFYLSGVK
jgi:hypothetical protein